MFSINSLFPSGVIRGLRCFALPRRIPMAARGFLLLCPVLLCSFGACTDAEAAITCNIAFNPSNLTGTRLTVSGGTSVAPVDIMSSGARLSCTGTAGEQLTQMQACTRFVISANAPGGYLATLNRSSGTQTGSMTNRLILTPLDGQGNPVTSTVTTNSMLAGRMVLSGTTGLADFPMRFRIAAPPGALIEAGTYDVQFYWNAWLVESSGPPAASGCNGTSLLSSNIQVNSVISQYFSAIVPRSCTMTQPGTLDFGQHTSITASALQASSQFNVSCNSTSDKFHVYIDEGQNALAGQRRMKRSGSDDFVAYDLLDRDNVAFPTTTVADPTVNGKYTQTPDLPGAAVMINGRVPQQSQNVPNGSYSDRVTIHVQY